MRLIRRSLYSLIVGMLLAFPVMQAHADDLCPDTTKGEKALTVNNMTGLQFDIGRLNLCLQRARLLQQIDEIVKKREELRLQPAPAVEINTLGNIPKMAASMPPLPNSEAALPMAQPILAAKSTGEWKIQRIWGQGSVMQAQLVKDDVIANVKSGDTLPSGETVAELSGKGVTLDDGKQKKTLIWAGDVKAAPGAKESAQ
jgi:hypothetical protein